MGLHVCDVANSNVGQENIGKWLDWHQRYLIRNNNPSFHVQGSLDQLYLRIIGFLVSLSKQTEVFSLGLEKLKIIFISWKGLLQYQGKLLVFFDHELFNVKEWMIKKAIIFNSPANNTQTWLRIKEIEETGSHRKIVW